jgi:hypothetical protein
LAIGDEVVDFRASRARVSPRQPWLGDRVEIHIGFAARKQAFAAKFGKALVDTRSDGAELRVAAVAEAEHGKFQILDARSALAREEFDESARIIRRIAIALGADDDVQQALGFQLAQRVGIGAQQAHRESGSFRFTRQLFCDAPGIAGLAPVDDRQLLRYRGFNGRQRRHFTRQWRPGGKAGGVTGKPDQRGLIEAFDQTRQQAGLLFRQRYQGADRFGGHGAGV